MFRFLAYADWNVMARFSVKVLPVGVTVVVAKFREHWLFCNMLTAPGVAAVHAVPVSFSKFTWLVENW